MAGKIRGKSHEAYYARYKSGKVWERNRTRKLNRALKRNPENAEQIKAAMECLVYRRRTPTTSHWSATTRRIAQLFKLVQGRVPKQALNYTGPIDEKYWAGINAVKQGFINAVDKAKQTGSMFALGLRVKM